MPWPFSTSTRTIVSTSTARMLEDDAITDIRVSAPLTAILREESVSSHIINAMSNSMGNLTRNSMNYARNSYTYGLPNSRILNDRVAEAETKAVIEDLYGAPVNIEYHYFDFINYVHYGFHRAIIDFQYNPLTNRLPSLDAGANPEEFAYLIKIQGFIDPGSLPFPGSSVPNETIWEATLPEDRFIPFVNPRDTLPVFEYILPGDALLFERVTLHYGLPNNGNPIINQREIAIPQGLLSFGAVQTKFTYDFMGTTSEDYFTYIPNQGQYPTIDALFNLSEQQAFTPFVFFRNDGVDLTTEDLREGEAYKTSRTLLDRIGVDYQSISDSIHENPDIDQVSEAVFMFGVPVESTHPLDSKYVYNFFDWVLDNTTQLGANNAFEVADLLFNISITYTNIQKNTFVGTYDNTVAVVVDKPTVGDTHTDIVNIAGEVNLFTYLQTGDNSFDVIAINNVELVYSVGGVKDVFIDMTQAEGRLLIPINFEIVRDSYELADADLLYKRSMHLVFNSKIIQNVEWYESPILGTLLLGITVFVVAITGGAAFGAVQAAYSGLAATYGALAAVTILALQYVATDIALDYAFTLIVEGLGEENALAAGAVGLGLGVFSALRNPTQGVQLIQQSANLINAASESLGDAAAELRREAAEFATDAENQLIALEEQRELLGLDTGINLDLTSILKLVPEIRFGETPDEYYDKTRQQNVGLYAYDYIENFVELTTRLPTTRETLEHFNRNN